MDTFQVRIINPKAKNILKELAELKLIAISEGEMEYFPLTADQKKRIAAGRKNIRQGKHLTHKNAMAELRKWVSKK